MIKLDYRSREPIYIQLKNSVIQNIMLGILKEGEQLPAVRTLATELGINPNTVQKAYRELEHEGVIYSMPYKGNYVGSGDSVRSSMHQLYRSQFLKLIADCLAGGMTPSEVKAMIQALLDEAVRDVDSPRQQHQGD